MLQISQETFRVLAEGTLTELAQRIDQWLGGVVPTWNAIAPQTRHPELGKMIRMAGESGMESERDVSVFAWICASLGQDWQARLTERDTASVLFDPQWGPEAKLMWLDETFRLSLSARANGGAA